LGLTRTPALQARPLSAKAERPLPKNPRGLTLIAFALPCRPMNRRVLLFTCVVPLVGCVGETDPAPEPTTDQSVEQTPPATGTAETENTKAGSPKAAPTGAVHPLLYNKCSPPLCPPPVPTCDPHETC
jgi:hypothetical protein